MRFVSLFAGIGGFDIGFEDAGMECVGQVENDKFCNRVLTKHWPDVLRIEDVRDVRGDEFGPVDVVSFGSPCQDLSVAGKRAGIEGERSALFFEAARIVGECKPRFAIWENVYGAFSSHAGRDFRAVVMAMAELGPRDIAWRTVDSQLAGVPQQRRRVFLVADFAGERAGEILLDAESCGGHSPPRGASWQDVAGPVGGGAYGSGRRSEDDPNLVAHPLGGGSGRRGHRDDLDHSTYIPEVAYALADATGTRTGSGRDAQDTFVAHTLRAAGCDGSEDGTGRGTPIIAIQDARGVRDKAQNGIGIRENAETMYTLDGTSQHADGVLAFDRANITSRQNRSRLRDLSPSLHTEAPMVGYHENRSGEVTGHGDAMAVRAEASHSYQFVQQDAPRMRVRRLTPIECARLQGFPDDWLCLCGQKPCRCPDGPQYRALGNAVTVPVVRHFGRRIMAVPV